MGFVLVLLLSVLALVQPATATCNDTNKLKLCYNMYMQSFELAVTPFPEYRAFKMVREMLLVEEGPTGQTKECTFQNALISCLNGLADSCITGDVFVSVFNSTAADATSYVQDYYMMQYTCNAGYDLAMKYFYCMEQIGLYHTNLLTNCSETEQSALANGGGCSAYNNYITCLSNIYTTYCGPDMRSYICPLETAGISHAAPECSSKLQDCSKPPPSSV